MPRAILLALIFVAAPLAGCAERLDAGDFTLTPNRIGWNVTAEASFNLTIHPAQGLEDPFYTIDPVFAIQSLSLDTGGVGGDFETDRAEDIGLGLFVAGRPVREHRLSPSSPTVEIRFTLPEQLKDSTYSLELNLFKIGPVESDLFRVNRP